MFAVIKTGGRQYRVAEDQKLTIGRIAGDVGSIVQLGSVMAVGSGEDVALGAPFVEGASVAVEVVEHGRAEKVIAFKKRRRQNSRRARGHRQLETTVRISEILTGGAKPTKAAAPKAEPKAAEPAAEAAGAQDDIALIGGVGPVLKEKLTAAGYGTLASIAALTADDAAKLDEELKLGGRIERDEWIEQAKELLAGKPPRAKVDREAAEQADKQ